MQDLDISQVIDSEKAINDLGSIELYQLMLPTYEGTSLLPSMEKLATAYNEKDWEQVKFHAHAIKGPAGYMGASRLHYACYYIQKAHCDYDI